jgi:hypothetical protein
MADELSKLADWLARGKAWWARPTAVGLLDLVRFRDELRAHNLYDTEDQSLNDSPPAAETAPERTRRTIEGTHNDPASRRMGSVDTRFGRNMPLEETRPDTANLLRPSPRVVSRELMTRGEFRPATFLNLLAAAWIQFQVHDWFHHGPVDAANGVIEIPVDEGDDWPAHPMTIPRTEPDPNPSPDPLKRPAHVNRVTHWWDGSQIYGSHQETTRKLRAGVDGKLRVREDGLLPVDAGTGLDLTGFTENWWLGLSLLHTLFTREHNAICDALKERYPRLDDDALFGYAHLINAALMAKIHTIEWTPAILPNPITQLGLRVNWHGLIGEGLDGIIPMLHDSEVLGGIPASHQDHHGVPYSITEEFVSVYRMHALLPDEYVLLSARTGAEIGRRTLAEVAFHGARRIVESVAPEDLFYSFGRMHPGVLRLHNYPRGLQSLTKPDGSAFDMAAVDILRDRERGVPRYNRFRELLRMPRAATFQEMTDHPEWAAELERVYEGDVDLVDLMTGMYAEPLPEGFGFSDTAFRIFLLMASRRLKSDRFFTDDYREEIYTDVGLQWVRDNGMASVLLRHEPALAPALEGVVNPFAPWKPVG